MNNLARRHHKPVLARSHHALAATEKAIRSRAQGQGAATKREPQPAGAPLSGAGVTSVK